MKRPNYNPCNEVAEGIMCKTGPSVSPSVCHHFVGDSLHCTSFDRPLPNLVNNITTWKGTETYLFSKYSDKGQGRNLTSAIFSY